MKKALKWRVALLAGATILAVLFFLPSLPFFENFPNVWKRIFPSKSIPLGLDCRVEYIWSSKSKVIRRLKTLSNALLMILSLSCRRKA